MALRLLPSTALAILATTLTVFGQGTSGTRPPAQGGSSPQAGSTPQTNVPVNHQIGTGAISGVITDGATKKPVGGAIVYLGIQGYGPVGRLARQVTDAKGRFVFVDLPQSDLFFLNVSKPGYNDGHYGDTGPIGVGILGGGHVKLGPGQWFPDANIPIYRPGAIGGTITDEHGDPVVGAHVRVLARINVVGLPHLANSGSTTTDDRGRYRITNLPPGTYLVNVPSVQTTVPASTPALEIDGLTPDTANRSRDDDRPRNNGAVALDGSNLLIIGNYVTPPLAGARPQAYPMAFYPAALTPNEASPIVLGNGESRDNVDLNIRPVAAVRVSGHVDGSDNAVRGLLLRLVAAGLEDLATGSEVATTVVTSNGDFAFLNVPPGNYTLDATRSIAQFGYGPFTVTTNEGIPQTPGLVPGPGTMIGGLYSGPPGARVSGTHSQGDASFWARIPITVGDADVVGVDVRLRRAVSLRGHIEYDGLGQPPGPTVIVAEPADGRMALGMPQSVMRPVIDDQADNDAFEINGMLPGEYVIRVLGLSPRQAVKSITIGGVDYTTKTIDAAAGQDFNNAVITYTDHISTVSGTVTGDPGGAHLMSVILFPAAHDQWTKYGFSPARMKTTSVSNTGTFKFDNVPAGAYQLVAVESSQSGRWQDPAFLEAASRVGTAITVNWGQTATQDLRLSVIK
jgi:hypothetical protein